MHGRALTSHNNLRTNVISHTHTHTRTPRTHTHTHKHTRTHTPHTRTHTLHTHTHTRTGTHTHKHSHTHTPLTHTQREWPSGATERGSKWGLHCWTGFVRMRFTAFGFPGDEALGTSSWGSSRSWPGDADSPA